MSSVLRQALQTNIAERIDPAVVAGILSKPPWFDVDGVPNCRDIAGGLAEIRSGFIWRSGMLESITERGKEDIVNLGIKKIFDLRSSREILEFPDPRIDGVEVFEAATDATLVPLDSVKFDSVR
jgi:hypothetical protein